MPSGIAAVIPEAIVAVVVSVSAVRRTARRLLMQVPAD